MKQIEFECEDGCGSIIGFEFCEDGTLVVGIFTGEVNESVIIGKNDLESLKFFLNKVTA